MKKSIIFIVGLIVGIFFGYIFVFFPSFFPKEIEHSPLAELQIPQKQIIGFLPYWLIDRANKNYAEYFNTLTYFGLNVDNDGSILKLANEQETEPGWNALNSGKVDEMLANAKDRNMNLSLLVFDGDQDSIGQLVSDPIPHAQKLIQDVVPIMKKYGFTDLNLDIESVKEASDESRIHFTQFVQEVKKGLEQNHAGTLTIEVIASDFIKKDLIDPHEVARIADGLVVMAYDFHYIGSSVTGPVAPLGGVGQDAEYDTKTAIQEALITVPPEKLILGIPSYGYEWETLSDFPRAAVIPGTGQTDSNARAENFLTSCATCSAQLDKDAQETYLIYKDEDTGTFHQAFFPDKNATQMKVQLADKNNLGGVAVWALGYEGKTILDPLKVYKNKLLL